MCRFEWQQESGRGTNVHVGGIVHPHLILGHHHRNGHLHFQHISIESKWRNWRRRHAVSTTTHPLVRGLQRGLSHDCPHIAVHHAFLANEDTARPAQHLFHIPRPSTEARHHRPLPLFPASNRERGAAVARDVTRVRLPCVVVRPAHLKCSIVLEGNRIGLEAHASFLCRCVAVVGFRMWRAGPDDDGAVAVVSFPSFSSSGSTAIGSGAR